ncbi:HDOD domain-containing protein [Pelagicoccus sp. SDUM812005]|uniref:HDOD domain-containing protein n=1 Tax=Pelagicoccus sp. SDUM812005 TaxID=3041257 RepID=UPI00280D9E7A|nr:HDOD domain-containing protein [Pelagicoccus sp. SDUM812005]MDQ8182755.1 HDOD domain-containing protein [Pelagicoccus sp. SDUM812005]
MGSTTNDHDFEETVKSIGDLHGNMAVLSKLDAVLKDLNTDISEPERLIQSDGAISGTIVQISNSPLYGFTEKSDSIATALQKVGYNQALKLVGMALSKQVFMRDLESYGITADSYWRYSYFTAVFLERQAKALGLNSDEAYLFGLLHSIGRVVINEILYTRQVEVFWDRFIPEKEWEMMMIGFTNQKAGALLLRLWEFPPELCKRVENQNASASANSDLLVSLLDYARALANHLIDPPRLRALCRPDTHPVQKKLRLPAAQLLKEVNEIAAHVEEVYASLKDC